MPLKAPDDFAQHREKDAVVFVIEKDQCTCVAAAGEVVERTRKFEAKGASHRGIGKRLLLRFGVVTVGSPFSAGSQRQVTDPVNPLFRFAGCPYQLEFLDHDAVRQCLTDDQQASTVLVTDEFGEVAGHRGFVVANEDAASPRR
jgi:hypothetical protein